MTRGNQREIDRQRALNRHAGKGTPSEGDPAARRERDANALAAKIAKKKADEEAAAAAEAAKAEFMAAAGATAAAPAASEAAAPAAPPEEKKPAKKKEDLSFLDASVAKGPKR